MVKGLIIVTNHYNQDAIAKLLIVKQIIDKINFNIIIDRVQAYKKITGTFQ